jgi:hypothetical protein
MREVGGEERAEEFSIGQRRRHQRAHQSPYSQLLVGERDLRRLIGEIITYQAKPVGR